MRQILCTLCAVFALLCLASVAQVSAAPAPALTQVVPVALRAEETVWIPAEEAYPNRLPEGVVFRGEHLYVKTRFIGYPAWNLLAYRSGSETGRDLSYTEVERRPLTDGTRIIIGYEQTVMIPFAELGTGEVDLCVAAADAGSGAPRYAYVRGIRTEKAPQ